MRALPVQVRRHHGKITVSSQRSDDHQDLLRKFSARVSHGDIFPACLSRQKGTAVQSIARLAIPAFFTLVAEPLFLLVDSAIIGHLGAEPLAALGVASTLLLSITGIFVFLAYATTAVVARALGAQDPTAAIRAGFDGVWLAVAVSVPLALVTALAAHPLSAALGTEALAPAAATYLRVSALGLPAMLVSLAVQGLLRGVQDTRTPLAATSVGFTLNAGLNAFLVLGLGWGLAGSAAGTVIAQWLMCLFMVAAVLRRTDSVPLRPHPARVLAAARFGLPLFIRTLALRGVLLLTTAVAANLGTLVMAAHQITSTVFSFLSFALDALAIAAQALTGEALGRGDRQLVRSTTQRFIRLGWIWGAVAGLILGAVAWVLPAAFTTDPDVRHATTAALLVLALAQPCSGVLFVLDGVLMGAGDGVFLAKAQLAVLTLYLPLAAAVFALSDHLTAPWQGATAVWLIYSAYLVMRWAALARRARRDAWMENSVPL